MKIKKKSIRELSNEISRTPYVPVKINKFKLFFLRLIGVNLKPSKLKVGDLLKRKGSDNEREMYEVKQSLFDENLDRVVVAHDFIQKQLITIHELDFGSFYVYNDVVPGTMVNPKDDI